MGIGAQGKSLYSTCPLVPMVRFVPMDCLLNIGIPLVKCISLRILRIFSDGFRLSRSAFYSSTGTNSTIGTNGLATQSIGIPLVKCISLRTLRVFSDGFKLSRGAFYLSIDWYQWYDWYQWNVHSIHWYSIGEMYLIKDTQNIFKWLQELYFPAASG